MGGLFRAPKPVVVSPPPVPAVIATPAAPPAQQGEAAAAAARSAAALGLEGTIATSPVGVLTPLPTLDRASLLGE